MKGLVAGSTIKLVEDPYTEKEARTHILRIRELIGSAGDRSDVLHGLSAGMSLHDAIAAGHTSHEPTQNGSSANGVESHSVAGYDFEAPASIQTILLPRADRPLKTVKSLSLSAWNPPPHNLRQKGHLLYLQVTTNEGEQFQITSHISGFFANKSSNSKFDPFPRPAPKNASSHSLLSLIAKLSPSFEASFKSVQEFNSRRDPLAHFQVTNALAANPWLVTSSESALSAHQPDWCRSQETYLLSGLDNSETLRDWNEEFQAVREQQKDTVQDRVFRERITSKLFADYTEAAARGAVMVARGEIPPLNPTEQSEAQIFVYNNIFFSFGADGVGTFTSEGGDEAARAAVGKDVGGVRLVNQLDIDNLFTPGTVIVNYLGKRIVCQSIVPGIFKQREPGENQIDYGGVEGRESIASNEEFVPVFEKLSKSLHIKRHDVWDKDGKKHRLEGSVETKGLLGTDGRKYVLDLYRLTPLDITWLEEHWSEVMEGKTKPTESNYPHRMTVLRHELIEAYWRSKLTEYANKELQSRAQAKGVEDSTESKPSIDGEDSSIDQATTAEQQDRIDFSGFTLAFNTDVFSSQTPQTDEEKEELAKDEEQVREVCKYLSDVTIPGLVKDLQEGDVGFPMDGQSLARLMHKHGINIRYLGKLATAARSQTSRLDALTALAIQEMVARAFKHVTNRYLKDLPALFAANCISHLLNCLLGTGFNESPKSVVDEEMQTFYPEADWSFTDLTPQKLRAQVEEQVYLRYRYTLDENWNTHVKHLQLLREIALKLGLQLTAKEYQFSASMPTSVDAPADGNAANGTSNGKKKKKNGEHELARRSNESLAVTPTATFEVEDILNLVPIVKDASPRSILAEEALEAGRLSIAQNQKDLGLELLLESLSLHEQVYGILHPEVARVYHQLSMLYYQLEEKSAAVELARKAVIVSERVLGVDSNETILSYLNLGLFEHGVGNTKVALTYIKHALELWKVIYGLRHPDSITTINNAAVMLQHLKQYHDSRLWFEKSLEICEEVSGKNSVSTATLYFQLAQALALDQDAKAAVVRMREAYTVFKAQLGPEDRNTKESEGWLEQLTHNAVSIAKHAKDVQNRKLRRIQLTPRVTLGMKPQPQVGQSTANVADMVRNRAASIGVDSRNVDELIRFIESGGDSTNSPSSKKRAQRSNPKRRGGPSRPATVAA